MSTLAVVERAARAVGALVGFAPNDADVVVSAQCAAVIAWCLIGSWVRKTYSFVDQLWSVAPVVYVATYAYHARGTVAGGRLAVMCALSALWGARLTYNFARKGGYAGEEDYRWAVLRKHKLLRNRVAWEVFNVTFIAFYQNVLLLLITLPAAVAYRSTKAFDVMGADGAAVACWCVAFAIEAVADEQQWKFQQSKRDLAPKVPAWREDYLRGFLTHGLFAYSRHPNFFAEQCIWVAFSMFAAASSSPVNYFTPVIVGPVLLILLFQGSTAFTESITAKKYAEYKKYQECTSTLVLMPRFKTLPPPKRVRTPSSRRSS
jgi:steroid 5-alpha reductase family enzyme